MVLAPTAVTVGVAAVDSAVSMRVRVSTEYETEVKMIDVEAALEFAVLSTVTPSFDSVASMRVTAATGLAPVITSTASMVVTASGTAALGPYPMGMNKTAQQTAANGAWTKNTSMGARSGYGPPVSNELVAQVAGSYKFYALDARNGDHSTNACRIQRLRSGTTTTVATSPSGAQNSTITTGSVSVAVGDRFWLESYVSTVGTAARQINTSTYLYFNAA